MDRKKIIIVGAGLAGLSAAWHLKQKGIECSIFEKESETGGLCRSKHIKGFTFDYDGHLLHFKGSYVFDLIRDKLSLDISPHQRSSWVYAFKRYIPYPFQANLSFLPPRVAKECRNDFIKSQRKAGDGDENFAVWIRSSFGKGIARHFMEPYNRKFWKFPLHRISCAWVNGLVPRPSREQIFSGCPEKKACRIGYNCVFWYPPKGGIGRLAQAFEKQLGGINKGCAVKAIDIKGKVAELSDGRKEKFDVLISTVPLPELRKIAYPLPAGVAECFSLLKWNSVLNVNLGLGNACHRGKHWVYFPDKDDIFFRVGFPHNFSGSATPGKRGSVYVEVSYRNKPIDNSVSIVLKDLEKNGIIGSRSDVMVRDINDIKYAYPIYDLNYSGARRRIINFFSRRRILLCGRYGNWRYMSMEDAILDGKRAAEAVNS